MPERLRHIAVYSTICIVSAALAGTVLWFVHKIPQTADSGFKKTYHIGIIYRTNVLNPMIDGFKNEMTRLGYVEGKNVVYDQLNSFNDTNLLNFNIYHVISENANLIVALGAPVAEVVRQKNSTIPTVFYSLLDPVGENLIASFRSSGNNFVGVGGAQIEYSQIDLMKKIAPLERGLGVIVFPNDQLSMASLKKVLDAARVANVTIVPTNVDDVSKIGNAFAELQAKGITGVYLTPGAVAGENIRSVAKAAIDNRLFLMGVGDAFAEGGTLVSFNVDAEAVGKSLAGMAQSIFSGKKPTDISSSFPTKTSFAINRKTAEAIGFTIPSELLAEANKVY